MTAIATVQTRETYVTNDLRPRIDNEHRDPHVGPRPRAILRAAKENGNLYLLDGLELAAYRIRVRKYTA